MILWRCITKTRIYKFDPLKSHCYIVKLGLQGYTLFFLILLAEVVRTRTHNLCFEQKYEKCQNFLSENVPFLVVKFSIYLTRHVFVMCSVGSSLCGLVAACYGFFFFFFFFFSCSLSYCCVSWILSSTVIILLGKREPPGYKNFSCSTQLSMKFFMLIKSQNTINCQFFLAEHSWAWKFLY